jgi:peptidase E
MDKIIKEAYEKGVVLAGKSAGAICFGKYDREIQDTNNYIKISCLNFLELFFGHIIILLSMRKNLKV